MVKMVTGEDVAIGKTIATQLGLGSNIVAASDIFTGDVGQTEVPQDGLTTADVRSAPPFASTHPTTNGSSATR